MIYESLNIKLDPKAVNRDTGLQLNSTSGVALRKFRDHSWTIGMQVEEVERMLCRC